MHIIGDDREVIVQLHHLSVENGPGDQYNILHRDSDSIFERETIMATYSSKKRAKKEIKRVTKAFLKGKDLYKMKRG